MFISQNSSMFQRLWWCFVLITLLIPESLQSPTPNNNNSASTVGGTLPIFGSTATTTTTVNDQHSCLTVHTQMIGQGGISSSELFERKRSG